MWPMGTQPEFIVTTLVVGLPSAGCGAAVHAGRRRPGAQGRRLCSGTTAQCGRSEPQLHRADPATHPWRNSFV
jgi:hypothetical protein